MNPRNHQDTGTWLGLELSQSETELDLSFNSIQGVTKKGGLGFSEH